MTMNEKEEGKTVVNKSDVFIHTQFHSFNKIFSIIINTFIFCYIKWNKQFLILSQGLNTFASFKIFFILNP